jgi:hypothetical protein
MFKLIAHRQISNGNGTIGPLSSGKSCLSAGFDGFG